MKIKLMIGALIGGVCLAFAAKDPVLMTINGKDIHLSEFEKEQPAASRERNSRPVC